MSVGGNYVPLVLLVAGQAVEPGEMQHITVLHDEGCPRLSGGVCSCEPEIVLGRPGEAVDA